MINFKLFPKSQQISSDLLAVVNTFQTCEDQISSQTQELSSNEVLAFLADSLEKIGFIIEKSKKKEDFDLPKTEITEAILNRLKTY